MKPTLFKPLFSTTLIASLLLSASPAFAASADVVAAAAPVQVDELTLDSAVEKALKSSVELELLKLDLSNTYYNSRLTLIDTRAIREDSIYSLDDAESKYEDEAGARRDYLVANATWKAQEDALRLDVQKAYFEVQAAQEKVELQKKYIKVLDSTQKSSRDAKDTLDELESAYQEALAKLNGLLGEAANKEWKLVPADLTSVSLSPLEEIQQKAFAKRPDMVTVAAEKTFAQAKVNYINNYASLSTFPGRIAQNDLRKAELLYTLAQKKAEQEVKASYEKVNEAKEAWEKIKASHQSAEEQYREAYRSYLGGQKTLAEFADEEEEWLKSTTKTIESAYAYNVAVAAFLQSTGY
ncbi:TolC family protein [Brevibacillus nitrificans]|uniref:TolC family protein n=1 Tax=Brevibacillus nitrificans TaxID=651560 RepID=A0A3M8DEY4_9BACL|nr:TolC family protein [Brevibacillus nitrificans]RNB86548.1 TolC family protein [Brevibacillus nitrificans]